MAEFAFVFPGQGSQSVGMLDAWGDHPAVRDTLALRERRAVRVLRLGGRAALPSYFEIAESTSR